MQKQAMIDAAVGERVTRMIDFRDLLCTEMKHFMVGSVQYCFLRHTFRIVVVFFYCK